MELESERQRHDREERAGPQRDVEEVVDGRAELDRRRLRRRHQQRLERADHLLLPDRGGEPSEAELDERTEGDSDRDEFHVARPMPRERGQP